MPVTASTAAPFTGLFLRWFDEPTYTFQEIIATTTPLHPMWGYTVLTNGSNATVGVTGSLNTGNFSAPTLTSTYIANYPAATPPIPAGYNGWNFVGNPYPSSSDWESSGWMRTNVEPTKYIWNGTLGGYQTYNAVTHESINGGDKYIRPEQSFFVHVPTEGVTGFLSVNNSTRVHTTGPYVKKSTGISDKLVLTASANGLDDEAHIAFVNDATLNFDPEYDAYKLMGVTQAPNLYSRLPSDILAAVNWLPWTGTSQVVPMGFNCGLSGVYNITASNLESFNPSTLIYLEDLKKTVPRILCRIRFITLTMLQGKTPAGFCFISQTRRLVWLTSREIKYRSMPMMISYM
jgi:hypothetical protein